MPLYLQPDELEAGMRLAKPVICDRRVLLPAGRVLNPVEIDNLRKRYPRATVYILDPVLDEWARFQDDSRDSTVALAAREKLVDALSGVREKFASRMSLRGMSLRGVHEALTYITQYLQQHPDAAAMVIPPGKEGSYLIEHPANVFYLSLVVGNALRGLAQHDLARRSNLRSFTRARFPVNLTPLGLAALFMDVALWPLEEVFEHPGPLSAEERKIVAEHPAASVAALPPDTPEAVTEIVLRHHENMDGTGYPDGLTGEAIPLFARILRITDAFDAATSRRVFREAKSAPRALWEMTVGPYAQFYDPVVLKIFGSVVQPFPIGAKVRLACGRYGVVVRFGERYSLLPEIIIAFDEDGRRLPRNKLEGPYKLDRRTDIRIAAYDGEDISDLYNSGTWYSNIEMPYPASFETLFESLYP